jgi:hypothetical protein
VSSRDLEKRKQNSNIMLNNKRRREGEDIHAHGEEEKRNKDEDLGGEEKSSKGRDMCSSVLISGILIF